MDKYTRPFCVLFDPVVTGNSMIIITQSSLSDSNQSEQKYVYVCSWYIMYAGDLNCGFLQKSKKIKGKEEFAEEKSMAD